MTVISTTSIQGAPSHWDPNDLSDEDLEAVDAIYRAAHRRRVENDLLREAGRIERLLQDAADIRARRSADDLDALTEGFRRAASETRNEK